MTPWGRACIALQLLRIDPALGGIALRARVGPARDAFTAGIGNALSRPVVRLHPAVGVDELDGGVDVTSSLGSGTLVHQRGLLDRGAATFVLPMAERLSPLLKTRLCSELDTDTGHFIIALDEGAEPDEALPDALLDRLAFHVNLEGVASADLSPLAPITDCNIANVVPSALATEEIVTLSVRLGIDSLRAPMLALRAARANAALNRRTTINADDVLIAAELVLAPRATRVPEEAPETEPEQSQEPQQDPQTDAQSDEGLMLPDEILLAAIQTALPPDLLAGNGPSIKASSGSGAGARRIGNRRGRPLPPRDGSNPSANARVDLFATLRAAVPWQRLRRAQYPARTGAIVLPRDLRHKRYLDLSDRLLVFAVDASGSSAISRLAEAKGAVELLLAEAYAKRDQVALIAFRGDTAETLLPPTRSLVQTKRRLADLPGGGATPLAAGMQHGFEAALNAQRKGLSPVLILLTDGRGNIALDGTADRKQAAADAQAMAVLIASSGIESIVIDTSNRPEKSLKLLAATLRGRYIALPRADARKLSQAVSASLES